MSGWKWPQVRKWALRGARDRFRLMQLAATGRKCPLFMMRVSTLNAALVDINQKKKLTPHVDVKANVRVDVSANVNVHVHIMQQIEMLRGVMSYNFGSSGSRPHDVNRAMVEQAERRRKRQR